MWPLCWKFLKKTLFIILAFYFVFLFFEPNQAYAAISIDYSSSPPSSNKVSDSFCAGVTQTCWNSQSVGVTDCGTACTGGSPWTKHEYDSCYVNPEKVDDYIAWLPPKSAVYSTADKCSDGSNNPPSEPYLRGGSCSGGIGGIYKTCCSNATPSLVSSDSCVAIQPFSGAPYPPMDGVCPAGSQPKFCGFGGYPACGQEACGPVTLPPSPPIGFLCGDGFCESFLGENSANCPQDCALPPVCGNGTCEAGEDSGNCPSDCPAAPPSTTTASCTVSWNLSNTNPPTNSTVTADVRGESITNASWTNVAYSLDNGGWNTGVTVTSSGATPTFRFSVPSGSTSGTHSLRFAIGNGSTVCSPSSSFVTQAPPLTYYRIGGKVLSSTGSFLGHV